MNDSMNYLMFHDFMPQAIRDQTALYSDFITQKSAKQ